MATASDRVYLQISMTEAFKISELLGVLAAASTHGAIRGCALDMRETLNDYIASNLDRVLSTPRSTHSVHIAGTNRA